jgi:hypothetical protein
MCPAPLFTSSYNIQGGKARNILISNSNIMSSNIDMGLRHITNLRDPNLEFDAVNKKYLDEEMTKVVEIASELFNGQVITLTDLLPTDIGFNVKPGSYIILIQGVEDGFPTASVSVSKSTVYQEGFIARLTGTPGLITGEQIIVTWPSASNILISKSGEGYNGNYITSINCQNLSGLKNAPIQDTDIASKAYVDLMIQEKLQVEFGGIEVTLNGTEFSSVANLRPGSYLITVSPVNITNAPTSSFALSKNSANAFGNVVRTTSCPGNDTGEELEIIWNPNEMIKMRKTNVNYSGIYLFNCGLKNFSMGLTPTMPTDLCTLDYVNNAISTAMDAKFGGFIVTLTGTEFVDVACFRPGTYLITVLSLVTGGPTASFSISKVCMNQAASSIIRMSGTPGINSNCEIDIIWEANSNLQIRKTEDFVFSGNYCVDTNLKNIGTPIAQIPSDIASKNYVDEAIQDKIDFEFSGIIVQLSGTFSTFVAALRLGTYMISISPLDNLGPTSGFMISKSVGDSAGNITRISAAPGKGSKEMLILTWEPNQGLMLSKDGIFHDGRYCVSFDIKNFSTVPNPVLPSDTATREFVLDTFETIYETQFSGVSVNLVGTDFFEVVALKSGSFTINVSGTTDGCPTSAFSVSKASQCQSGNIVCITSCPGKNGGNIELVWPENSKLLARKTTTFHDSEYIFDFNLKNFSNATPPQIPSDIATKSYIDDAINEFRNVQFGGIKVQLTGTEFVDIAPLSAGSYILTVKGLEPFAPTSSFSLSKNCQKSNANIQKITSFPGTEHCELELVWQSNEKLRLRKTNVFCDSVYIVNFDIKNFTQQVESVIPSELATHDFVLQTLQDKLDAYFCGIKVHLTGTTFQTIGNFKAGSYIINVSPLFDSGPSCSVVVSKSSIVKGVASVVRITSSPAIHSGTELEIVWGENEPIKIRKLDLFSDGDYICDMNLRNYSSGPTLIESDLATMSFVKDFVNKSIDFSFGGLEVYLDNDEFVSVCPLKIGSYLITISPRSDGGSSAIFNISKSSSHSIGNVIRTTSSPGDFQEELELVWYPNAPLMLRKTSPFNSMTYLVNLNLKSLNNGENKCLEPRQELSLSSFATQEFVEEKISEIVKGQVGITVSLSNTTFSTVTVLKAGSYNVNVSPLFDNGPSCSFVVSKSSITQGYPNISRLSSSPGPFGCELELVWNPNEPLMIRKTLENEANGEFLCSFNLLNTSNTPLPQIPSDLASVSFVQDAIQEALNQQSGEIELYLDSDTFLDVCPLEIGSYIITISPLFIGGTSAIFNASKGSPNDIASINRTSSFPGKFSEELELVWMSNQQLKIRKTNPFNPGKYRINTGVKSITNKSLTVNPLLNQEYIDARIKELMQEAVSGTRVFLSGTEYVNIGTFQAGSYNLNVSPLVHNGPSCSVTISKSNLYKGYPNIQKTSSSPGTFGTELDIIWNENSPMQIRKNSEHDDGEYLINSNIVSFTSVPTNNFQSDVASVSFVKNAIDEALQIKFGGIKLFLDTDIFYDISPFAIGSYVLSVSPTFSCGTSAVFNISKSSQDSMGNVVRVSSSPGKFQEELELIWYPNSPMRLRKTLSQNPGDYIIQTNLMNIRNDPLISTVVPELGSFATIEFVNNKINEIIQQKFSGVSVYLSGTTFSDVTFLEPGSYNINVSCKTIGGPCASWTVSKCDIITFGDIVRLTSSGKPSLELVWNSNVPLQLRKLGVEYDSEYTVNFNIANFYSSPEPLMSQNLVTKEYLDSRLKNESSTIKIFLVDDTFSVVSSLTFGSYLVTIKGMIPGSATGTFSVSKTSDSSIGNIVKITGENGILGESLELIWSSYAPLMMRKNIIGGNNEYIVDFNSSSNNQASFPVLSTDLATKNFVLETIQENQTRSLGINVYLSGIDIVNVTDLQYGSYIVSVSGVTQGLPTGSWSVSKSSNDAIGNIVKLTGDSNSSVSLILTWNSNSPLTLSKDNASNGNGNYMVSMSSNVISSNVTPIVPNGNVKSITLTGIAASFVFNLDYGNYLLLVSSTILNAPIGTFSLLNNNSGSPGIVSVVSSIGGSLDVVWNSNGDLYVNKQSMNFDGEYIIKYI